MILEHVEIAVLDGQESAFEVALCEVRQRVFMSRGFRAFTVAQGVMEYPSTYLVQVRWESPRTWPTTRSPASSGPGHKSLPSLLGRCA